MRIRSGLGFALSLAVVASGRAQGGAIRAGTALSGAASAPRPADARRGFWIGAGLGTGAGSLQCRVCENAIDQGTSGYLRAGGTLTRKLLLGVEGSGWQGHGGGGKRRVLAFTGGAWWYPSERHGYFLRGGAGISWWRAWQSDQAVISQAFALVLGAGYEAHVNPGLSVVPYLNILGSSGGSLWLENSDAVSYERRRLPSAGHALMLQIGVGLTRH